MVTSKKTRWGIELPQFFVEGPIDMPAIQRFATRAEALGFDGLWVEDLPARTFGWLEAIALLTYVAAHTRTVRLGTNILITPLRDPVQLAKSLATLDYISGGRLVLGVGMGGASMHYPQYGMSPEHLVPRFLEGLQVMKRLWTEPLVNHRGAFFQVTGLTVEPKPVQRPHLPVWFGALHPNAVVRAARLADGWIGSAGATLAHFKEDVARITHTLEEAGRERAAFTIARQVHIAVDKDKDRAWRRVEKYYTTVYTRPASPATPARSAERDASTIMGGPAECAEKLAGFVAAGAEVIILQPLFDHLEQAELLAKEVVPAAV